MKTYLRDIYGNITLEIQVSNGMISVYDHFEKRHLSPEEIEQIPEEILYSDCNDWIGIKTFWRDDNNSGH